MKSSPEKALKSIHKAVHALTPRVDIDNQFPDLGRTFKGLNQNEYIMATEKAVQPFVIKQTASMPPMALSQMPSLTANSPRGIASFMDRAYFVIGKCIHFWNYNKREDVVYHSEDAEIVGVGFVTPQKNIFNDTIKKLMIVTTTTSIRIVAINYDNDTFRLIETGMMTSATGVLFRKIHGTAEGRVFMLAEEGSVWELGYQREEGWFTSKCYKRLLSSSGFAFLYRGPPESVVDLAISNDGKVMYQLTAQSHIHVTSLVEESSGYNTVVKRTDIFHGARLLCPNSTLMDSQTFKIISLFPTNESKHYQLVAITSTGCRLYFSHFKNGVEQVLPNALDLLHVRTPPPNEFQNGVNITYSAYNYAVTMLVKGDSLVVTNPDVGSLATQPNTGNVGLFEFCTTLQLTGKVLSILEVTTPASLNEMANVTVPARQYLVFTENGLSTMMKQRPIDMLSNLIIEAQSNTRARTKDFESFFQHFGPYNGCAICFDIITASHTPTAMTPALIRGAKELLDQFGPLETLAKNGVDGLMLFVYRVIRPVWDKVLIKETAKDGVTTFTSAHPIDQLRHTQEALRKTSKYISKYVDPKADNDLTNMYEFINYLSQAIVFFLYIFESDSTTIIQNVPKNTCVTKTLEQLLTTLEGRHLVSDIATALIDYEFKKYQDAAYVIDVLEQHCGDFCGATDVILFKVARDMRSTTSSLHDAFSTLKKLAPEIPSDKTAELATVFLEQGCVEYSIQLALACAHARPKDDQRPFFDIVFAVLKTTLATNGDTTRAMATAFQGDKAYFEYMYIKFIRNGLGRQLIRGPASQHLEAFLKQNESYEHLNLLADYYRTNERYEDAARAFIRLARLPANISIDRRIELLTTASVCAKSVTSPIKQFEMNGLLDEIEQLKGKAYEERTQQVSVHT